MLGHRCGVDSSETVSDLRGVHQPDRDSFPVAERMIARRLDGVRERVAVVEDRPAATLALVRRHHVRLDPNASCDPVVERELVGATDRSLAPAAVDSASITPLDLGGLLALGS